MKFLCDAMLHGLAKWLRAAGYDTKIVEARANDQDVLKQALQEDRVLLTRDTHFLEMKEAEKCLVFLKDNAISECMGALMEKLDLNLIELAFTRCLVCNSLFEAADPKKVRKLVPLDVLAWAETFFYCPKCDKVFWQASHR